MHGRLLRGSGCIGSRSDPFSLVLAQRPRRRPVVMRPGAMDKGPRKWGEREKEVASRERKNEKETETERD